MNNIPSPVKEGTVRRNRLLLKNYCRIIKDYGETAKYLPKTLLYEEASECFGNINARTAGRIINTSMNNMKELEMILSEIEATEMLDILIELNKKKS